MSVPVSFIPSPILSSSVPTQQPHSISQSTTQSKISKELAQATTVEQIYKLLEICDLLHAGQSVPGYTSADLPSDAEYEFYKSKYNYQTDTTITDSTIMYMATIPKEKQIVEVRNAVIMAKYDGVSAAVLFVKTNQQNTFVMKYANTRGRTVGNTISNTDIKPKLEKLISHITFNEKVFKQLLTQSGIMNDSSVGSNGLSQDYLILNIAVRGEIILNHKELDNSGQTLNHPAAAVAGLINGGIDNFTKEIDNLCIQFYEIGYIDIVLNSNSIQRIIPTQKQAIILLKECYIYYKYVNPINVANPQLALDSKIYVTENTLTVSFNGIYEDLLSTIYYPTDGLVYCPRDWKYPQNKEAFGKRDYGKHAWKPTNSCYSFVEGIEWPITKNGELNPIVQFTEFQFNGTKYSQCKLAMGQLIEYQKHGFGIGAEILISIVNLKTAHIDEIIKPAEEVYKIPTKCPYCSKSLVLEDGKTVGKSKDTYVPKHLKCTNKNCIAQKIQKYAFFLTSLSKISKNLIFKNKEGKVVKSKISEKKLEQIYNDHGDLNNQILLAYVPNMLIVLDSLSHENQLYVLSFGGINQIKELIEQNGTTSWKQYDIEWFK